MARLSWVSVDANLPNHRKSIDLAARVGDPRAWTYLVQLWAWATQNEPAGVIRGGAARLVLEHVSGWRGAADQLTQALIDSGWIDVLSDGLGLHDWQEHQGVHIAKAEKDAERQRQKRGKITERFSSKKRPSVVHATSVGQPTDIQGSSDGYPCDGAGNKNTNKNTNKNLLTTTAPPPFELKPTGPKEKKQPAHVQFIEWAQDERLKAFPLALREEIGEKEHSKYSARHAACLEAVSGDLARLRATWLGYLEDGWAKKCSPPCPLAGFFSDTVFRRCVPGQSSQPEPERPRCSVPDCDDTQTCDVWGVTYCYPHIPAESGQAVAS